MEGMGGWKWVELGLLCKRNKDSGFFKNNNKKILNGRFLEQWSHTDETTTKKHTRSKGEDMSGNLTLRLHWDCSSITVKVKVKNVTP